MKIASTIVLSFGLSATMASDKADLRVNHASSRQLRNPNRSSGGTFLYYLMLNTLNAPVDLISGHGCDSDVCHNSTNSTSTSSSWGSSTSNSWGNGGRGRKLENSGSWQNPSWSSSNDWNSTWYSSTCERCNHPHISPPHPHHPPPPHPKPKKPSSSHSNSTWSSTWATTWSSGSTTATWSSGSDAWGSDSWGDGKQEKDAGSDEANNGNNGGNNGGNASQDKYLANESNGGSGNSAQNNGNKSVPVWPFLLAALIVGVAAVALMARRKRTKNRNHGLNASVKKRMELFTAGAYMSQRQKTATASLSANDYGNEPSMVEIRDPDGGVRVP